MATLIDEIEDDDELATVPDAGAVATRPRDLRRPRRDESRLDEARPNDSIDGDPTAPASQTRQFPAPRTLLVWAGVGAMALTAGGLATRGKGYGNRLLQAAGLAAPRLSPPLVIGSKPFDGSANVHPDEPIVVRLMLPNGQLDPATVTAETVQLRRPDVDLGVPVAVSAGAAADGVPTIVLTPAHPLDGGAKYAVVVSAGVKDAKGVALVPYDATFTTGSLADPSIRFEQVALPTAAGLGAGFTCVQFGPDGHLWAAADDGRILRYPVEAGGTGGKAGLLGKPTIYSSLQQANGGNRLLTGFCFAAPYDPTVGPVLWASHGWYGFTNAPDLTGKVSRISGPDLSVVEDAVVGLPRSVRDHLTNQPSFGPDGALYIPQASNSAFGAPDAEWGNRPEHKLNASILRLDVAALTSAAAGNGGKLTPIDVRTADVGGTYDPGAPGAPLTIYAEGVRLAYDLLWHSNGHLYAPANGSSAGGNTPATPAAGQTGPDGKPAAAAPALTNVPEAEHDWFFKVVPGRYYGHPNPTQGHYVLNGGNPTANSDPAEVPGYPVGTQPDPKWKPAEYDFGNHVSPDGLIEYRSGTFGGKLKGKVLVCRYNGGSDVLCLDLDANGDVKAAHLGIPGFGNLNNPLDLTEDPTTGCLYVSEYGAQKLTLLRPVAK